jgi:hypothetical protein
VKHRPGSGRFFEIMANATIYFNVFIIIPPLNPFAQYQQPLAIFFVPAFIFWHSFALVTVNTTNEEAAN